LYLKAPFYKPKDKEWSYSIGRIWPHLSEDTCKHARSICRELRNTNAFPLDFTYLKLKSTELGDSVRDSSASGCGFPNVYFPWLGYSLDVVLFDPIIASIDEFDRCIKLWTTGSKTLTSNITKGLVKYKDMVADACGEDFDHITVDNIFDHIDLRTGLVRDGDDGLLITLGEDCDWEPEHGVHIVIDRKGILQSVGEL
jgi:hypothetical protein